MLSLVLLISCPLASESLGPGNSRLLTRANVEGGLIPETSDLAASSGNEEAIIQSPSMQRIHTGLEMLKNSNYKTFGAGSLLGMSVGAIFMLCTKPSMDSNPLHLHFQSDASEPIFYRTTATTTTTGWHFPGAIHWTNPAPVVEVMRMYCPSGTKDFYDDGGAVNFFPGGWKIGNGYGRVRGKTSFDLLGGSISFRMNLENANPEVNTNFYTISPRINDNSIFSKYCDIQEGKWEPCMELDIVENNGKCKIQATVHTTPIWSSDPNLCDRGGCFSASGINKNIVDVKAAWDLDGTMHVYFGGVDVTPNQPWASKEIVKNKMLSDGALIVSSQWTGWVPFKNECPQGADLEGSSMEISDVRVQGKYKHGERPTPCD